MNKLARMCASMRTATAVLVLGLAAGSTWAWPIGTAHIIGVWDATSADNSVHFLDSNLNDLGYFPTGAIHPNGLATGRSGDDERIWSGHASTQKVIAYYTDGTEIPDESWSVDAPQLQGLEYVSLHPDLEVEVLAIANGEEIRLHNPDTGEFLDTSIPNAGVYTEGLAWDGEFLWQLSLLEIFKTDISDGSIVDSIPNPAVPAGCIGTTMGLGVNLPGQLTVASNAGRWWQVDMSTGDVIIEGDNGQDMYALKSVTESSAVPEPIAVAVLVFGPILLGRRRRRRRRR